MLIARQVLGQDGDREGVRLPPASDAGAGPAVRVCGAGRGGRMAAVLHASGRAYTVQASW